MGANTEARNFDLNIEKVLEGWEICHAIRELIANALDEQALTNTRDVDIFREPNGAWHIRDFGRGIKYEHLTQNENEEKLKQPSKVIGKFGVGLKDALATLHRRGVRIGIRSRFGNIALGMIAKSGFTDVITLHAVVSPPDDKTLVGTDIVLQGASDNDIAEAKNFFLKFSGERTLGETQYGQILDKPAGRKSRIYVTGILVAEEENFAFSYNITSLTAAMRKALNRERTNVGRTAYSERVKQMLLSSKSENVANVLVADLERLTEGTNCDEVKWMDVAIHAAQTLNALKKVTFVTATELILHRDVIDHAQSDGMQIVTIPDNIKSSLHGILDVEGNAIRDLSVYQEEWNDSFEFEFVPPEKLTKKERLIFDQSTQIASYVGGVPAHVRSIRISETMRPDIYSSTEVQGLWDPQTSSIVIQRAQLKGLSGFAGTLLHEIAHAKSGYGDVSREFESELTWMLGEVAGAYTQVASTSIQGKKKPFWRS
jgi:hypothetical protein